MSTDTPSSPAADGTAAVAAHARSEVQLKMARAIVEYLCRNNGMNVGNHVTEQELVEEFRISRSPVRAAHVVLGRTGSVRAAAQPRFLRQARRLIPCESSAWRCPGTDGGEAPRRNRPGTGLPKRVPQVILRGGVSAAVTDLGRSVATRVLFKLSDDGIIFAQSRSRVAIRAVVAHPGHPRRELCVPHRRRTGRNSVAEFRARSRHGRALPPASRNRVEPGAAGTRR